MILQSNDQVNLEELMKLQLSSEEESDGEGRDQNKAESSQGNATITLGAQSSLNSTD